jgi:methylthioribose-1-phosphate isomerase
MLDPVSWKLDNGSVIRSIPQTTDQLNGKLKIIDQTRLPEKLLYLELDDIDDIYNAIKRLSVRGAPAIGCAAALGLAAAAQNLSDKLTPNEFNNRVKELATLLNSSRPTAVNLAWALERSITRLNLTAGATIKEQKKSLIQEGLTILDEDIELCRTIGKHGAHLITNGSGILTHCNAGALATGDYGTALSPLYVAHEQGVNFKVFADETRPLLQGARLTAWELSRAGIDVTTICDNMAGQVMKEGKINAVIVGSDRIAANGDAANKIGTYSVAILAQYHRIPFYVAAPYSTIDMSLEDGTKIPIEQRDSAEIQYGFGRKTAPDSSNFYNPAFDVTPHQLITGIITEKGVIKPPFKTAFTTLYT